MYLLYVRIYYLAANSCLDTVLVAFFFPMPSDHGFYIHFRTHPQDVSKDLFHKARQ